MQKLSLAQSREDVIGITRHAARELTGADGATFILREGDLCSYVDEDAIEPLWKGRRFPMVNCVSGWLASTIEGWLRSRVTSVTVWLLISPVSSLRW